MLRAQYVDPLVFRGAATTSDCNASQFAEPCQNLLFCYFGSQTNGLQQTPHLRGFIKHKVKSDNGCVPPMFSPMWAGNMYNRPPLYIIIPPMGGIIIYAGGLLYMFPAHIGENIGGTQPLSDLTSRSQP